jgi:DNA polymerase-4
MLVAIAQGLLAGLRLERARVRLIGVRLAGLGPPAAPQPTLLDAEEGGGQAARWGALDRATDAIAARFGAPAVSVAALLDDGSGSEEDEDGGTTVAEATGPAVPLAAPDATGAERFRRPGGP